jgi:hypothetical protein
MSSYHILETSGGENNSNVNIRVAMHIASPAGTNLASTTFAACLVQDSGAVKTSVVPGIAAQEQTDLTNGAIVEHLYNFEINPGRTNADKQSILDQHYRDMVVEVQNRIKRKYWGWGYSRNVV